MRNSVKGEHEAVFLFHISDSKICFGGSVTRTQKAAAKVRFCKDLEKEAVVMARSHRVTRMKPCMLALFLSLVCWLCAGLLRFQNGVKVIFVNRWDMRGWFCINKAVWFGNTARGWRELALQTQGPEFRFPETHKCWVGLAMTFCPLNWGRKPQRKLPSKTSCMSKLCVWLRDPAIMIRWKVMEDDPAYHLGPSLPLCTQVPMLTHTFTWIHEKCAYTETYFTHTKIVKEKHSLWFKGSIEKVEANQANHFGR